jgi:hypothetical protein
LNDVTIQRARSAMSNAVLSLPAVAGEGSLLAKTFGVRGLDATPFLYPIDPAEDPVARITAHPQSTAVCLAIRSISAISVICLWNLAPPAVTRFQSSIIIAAIALSH